MGECSWKLFSMGYKSTEIYAEFKILAKFSCSSIINQIEEDNEHDGIR